MSTYTVASGQIAANSKQLVASTVDTVSFAEDLERVEVWSDGTAKLYFTVDASTPTVGGAGCWEIPANGPAVRDVPVPEHSGATVVKLISAGTPVYTVSRVG